MLVRDVMTEDPTTLGANDQLSIADDVMTLGRIRHMPIVDDDGDLVGILSQRDLLRGALSRLLGYGENARQHLYATVPIKEVMHNEVWTIDADAEVGEAARMMIDRKIGCVVVTQARRVVGIVTEADLLGLVAFPQRRLQPPTAAKAS